MIGRLWRWLFGPRLPEPEPGCIIHNWGRGRPRKPTGFWDHSHHK